MDETTSGTRNPVEMLAEQFLERRRLGESPSLEKYAVEYPDLADEIRELFPALLMMEGLGDESIDLTGSVGAATPGAAATGSRPERLGDFRILREVGRGGMGVVYEAEQEALGRRVALKVLPAQALMDSKQVRRFEREARAAARLHHTNIVPVFGVGHADGTHYYVMQFIQGQGLDEVLGELRRLRGRGDGGGTTTATGRSLSGRLDLSAASIAHSLAAGRFDPADGGDADATAAVALADPREDASGSSDPSISSPAPLPEHSELSSVAGGEGRYWRGLARIGLQVAEALAYAHGQGVLHRDIKPSNLLLDLRGNVWVADFGLAKAGEADDLTHTGDVVGTVRYMAPERFSGHGDARSDVYALGLTLYELIALQPAYDGQSRHELIRKVTQEEPPSLRRLAPEAPRDLETIVHKAIARDPAGRYASAGAMAEDLQRFLDDRPILARRAGPAERTWRWCRRNPWIAGLAAAFVLALSVGTITSTALAVQSSREAARALSAESSALASQEESAASAARAREAASEASRAAVEARHAEALSEAETRRTRRLLYAADMQLADQVWQSDDGTAAKLSRLLEEHVPEPGQEDLRDFSWRYHWTRLHHAVATFQDTGSIDQAAFDPEGRLLTLGSDRVVRRWDPSRPDQGGVVVYTPPFDQGSFALVPDGSAIALVEAGTTRLQAFDLASGRQKFELDLPATTSHLKYSCDGRWLLVLGSDRFARVYEGEEGSLHIERKLDNPLIFLDAELAADGTTLVMANHPRNGTVAIYDLREQDGIPTIAGSGSTVRALAISAEGPRSAWGNSAGVISLWDLEGDEPLGPQLSDVPNMFLAAEFSADGSLLAAGWGDGQVSLWDVKERRRLARLKGHSAEISTVEFSADGRRLATCDADGLIKVWDLASPQGETLLKQIEAGFRGVVFAPDGQTVAVTSVDGTLRLFEAGSGRLIRDVKEETVNGFFRVAFSPDGAMVATGQADGTVRLFDVESGLEARSLTLPPEAAPQGNTGVFDRMTAASVAFSPDGRWLAAGFGHSTLTVEDHDQVVAVWEVETGDLVRVLEGYRNYVLAVAFSPDGTTLYTASKDGTVRLWEVGSWREIRVLRNPARSGFLGGFFSMAVAPDGASLALGDAAGTIVLWDLRTDQSRLLPGHSNYVSALAFAPSGRVLASGSWDGTVKVWDVAAGRETLTLRGHTNWLQDVAFDPSGNLLASVGADGTARLWRADPLAVIDTERGASDPAIRARSLRSRGLIDRAILAYEQAIEARRDDEQLCLELAECYLQLGRTDSAAEAYAEALQRIPQDLHFESWRSQLCMELTAKPEVFDRVKGLRPDDPLIHFADGVRLAKDRQWGPAVEAFERAGFFGATTDYTSEHACLLLLSGDVEGYRRLVARMVEADGQSRDHLRLCTLARSASLAPGAVDDPTNLVRWAEPGVDASRSSWHRHALGLALHRAGDHQEAVRRLMESQDPGTWRGDVTNWLALALAHHALGDEDEARRWLARSVTYLDRTTLEVYREEYRLRVLYWLEALVLLEEAESLLGKVEPDAPGAPSIDIPADLDPAEIPEQEPHREPIRIDPSLLDAYVGRYRFALDQFVDVYREDDHLRISVFGRTPSEWYPETETSFFSHDAPYTFTFTMKGDGSSYQLIVIFPDGVQFKHPRVSDPPVTGADP